MIEQPERNDALAEPESDTSGPSTGSIILGGLLVLGGLVWLLDVTGVVDFSLGNILPIALILVGIGLVITARSGEHEGLIWLGVILTIVLTVTSLADIRLQGGVGDRDYRPATAAELRDSYQLGIGNLDLDLRDIQFPEGETRIEITLGMGDMTVQLPDDVDVSAEWTVAAGEADVFDRSDDGVIIEGSTQTSGFASAERRVRLDLNLGLGSIEVTQ